MLQSDPSPCQNITHSTGKETKKKGCIEPHANYEKYKNLLAGNPILIA